MNDTHMTDNELDALLAMPRTPIHDDGFTESLLMKMEKREKTLRYIPVVMGSIGAAITSYFMPTEIFQGLAFSMTNMASITEMATNPLTFAILLCLPLVATQFSSNNN